MEDRRADIVRGLPKDAIDRSGQGLHALFWVTNTSTNRFIRFETAGVERRNEGVVDSSTPREDSAMTREQVESALASGVPFALLMADGKEYLVPHRDYISLPPKASYVIVYDDNGHFTVLPLLAMTGLQSSIAGASAKEE